MEYNRQTVNPLALWITLQIVGMNAPVEYSTTQFMQFAIAIV